MIFGIITAIVFSLTSMVFFAQKRKGGSQIKKLFSAIHKPLGFLLAGLMILHLALTLKLIRQRPTIIFILGFAMLLCVFMAIITSRYIKKSRNAFALHKLCAFIILLLLTAHIFFCVESFNEYKRDIAAISFSDPLISTFLDGVYTGECDVGYIYAKVRVTVIGGKITDIKLLEHRNERGVAGEKVIDRILSEQRTDVDAVSSATNSSNVIKKAVENALTKQLSH